MELSAFRIAVPIQGLPGCVGQSVREQVAADVVTILVVGQRGQFFGLGAGFQKFVEHAPKSRARFGDDDLPFQQGLRTAAEPPQITGRFLVRP